jgi:hypothetical protein
LCACSNQWDLVWNCLICISRAQHSRNKSGICRAQLLLFQFMELDLRICLNAEQYIRRIYPAVNVLTWLVHQDSTNGWSDAHFCSRLIDNEVSKINLRCQSVSWIQLRSGKTLLGLLVRSQCPHRYDEVRRRTRDIVEASVTDRKSRFRWDHSGRNRVERDAARSRMSFSFADKQKLIRVVSMAWIYELFTQLAFRMFSQMRHEETAKHVPHDDIIVWVHPRKWLVGRRDRRLSVQMMPIWNACAPSVRVLIFSCTSNRKADLEVYLTGGGSSCRSDLRWSSSCRSQSNIGQSQ